MPVLSLGLNMNTLAEQASKLLDFNQKLDINLLDSIVACMYTGEGGQVCIIQFSLFYLFIASQLTIPHWDLVIIFQ